MHNRKERALPEGSMPKKFLWLDGKLVEATPALLGSLTPGVLKAKGVFETMRVDNGKVALLDAHLKRMSRGLKVLKLPTINYQLKIHQSIPQLLKLNRLKNARVRLMVWEKSGIHAAIVAELYKAPTVKQRREGFKAILTNGHRRSTPEPVKSLDYQIFRQNLRKARAAGYDEAIMTNRKGELVEGSRTNVFIIKGNVLLTPPVASGCLPGVMRQIVLTRARRLKIRCATKPLMPQDLLDSDEAFVTNALIGIVPLTRLDKRAIGTGNPGPVTQRLRKELNFSCDF